MNEECDCNSMHTNIHAYILMDGQIYANDDGADDDADDATHTSVIISAQLCMCLHIQIHTPIGVLGTHIWLHSLAPLAVPKPTHHWPARDAHFTSPPNG